MLRAMRQRGDARPVLIADRARCGRRSRRRPRRRRRRLPRQAVRARPSSPRASARCCAGAPGARSRSSRTATSSSIPVTREVRVARRAGRAVGARVRAARSAARAPRRDPVARAARGEALRLERGGREQRGRGAHPRAAPQARRRRDPQRARRGLDDRADRERRRRDRGARSIRRDLVVRLLAPACSSRSRSRRSRPISAPARKPTSIFDYQLTQMAASLTGVPLAGAPPGSRAGRRRADRPGLGPRRRAGLPVAAAAAAAARRAARLRHGRAPAPANGASSARSPATRSCRSRSR